MNSSEMLKTILAARSAADVRKLLEKLGDHADVELNAPFGPLGLFWHPFGDRESNISTIGLGTKAGRSLTERLTNAQDAILDAEAKAATKIPSSPWDAAELWFGRPRSDRDVGLYQWDRNKIDRRIRVVLLDSDEAQSPTVDVIDDGIGIPPDAFPTTILSLQAGNKIKNKHLIGAFGQGDRRR